jgi:putative transposase
MWDPLATIKLLYRAKNGQRVGPSHTPDFFLLRRQEAGFEEWKPGEELVRLSK